MANPIPPHMNPCTVDEVMTMLSSTMHGPLPHETYQRLFATLAEWAPKIAILSSTPPDEEMPNAFFEHSRQDIREAAWLVNVALKQGHAAGLWTCNVMSADALHKLVQACPRAPREPHQYPDY